MAMENVNKKTLVWNLVPTYPNKILDPTGWGELHLAILLGQTGPFGAKYADRSDFVGQEASKQAAKKAKIKIHGDKTLCKP